MEQKKTKLHGLSNFTPELGRAFCTLYAEGEKSLNDIAKLLGLKSGSTLSGWTIMAERTCAKGTATAEIQEFYARFARARLARGDGMAEEIRTEIRKTTTANANAQRVKIDGLKWLAARFNPNYAERAELAVSGQVEAKLSDKAPSWLQSAVTQAAGPAIRAAVEQATDAELDGVREQAKEATRH